MKRRTARQQRGGVKRDAPKPAARQDAEKHGSPENVTNVPRNLFEVIHQLQGEALDPDVTKSQSAFQTLSQVFHELYIWLQTMTALHPMSLGALLGGLPKDKA